MKILQQGRRLALGGVLLLVHFLPLTLPAQRITEVVYKQVDTVQLKMEIYRPETDGQARLRPAIIFFFGGGWISGTRRQFKPFAEHLASKGMVAILADYRIRSKHHTTPFESLKDAKSAMRYLRGHAQDLGIDPGCIVASGGSAGGHLAAACYTNENINELTDSLAVSAKPDALVLFNPVIDNSEKGYGYDRVKEAFPEFSPLHSIRNVFPPTIFFLGSKDDLIPVSTGEAFKQKIESVGGRCELFVFEGEKHGFFNKAEYREKIIPLVDRFLSEVACLFNPVGVQH